MNPIEAERVCGVKRGDNMKRLIAAALLVMGMISPAWGGFMSGNSLLDECQTPKHDMSLYFAKRGYCQGYIAGIVDGSHIGDSRVDVVKGDVGGNVFCMPRTANLNQAIDIVTNWLTSNPQDRHLTAASLVAYALAEVWPCK